MLSCLTRHSIEGMSRHDVNLLGVEIHAEQWSTVHTNPRSLGSREHIILKQGFSLAIESGLGDVVRRSGNGFNIHVPLYDNALCRTSNESFVAHLVQNLVHFWAKCTSCTISSETEGGERVFYGGIEWHLPIVLFCWVEWI